ncbi:hypothetical protein M0R89_13620 [Halorussus limi]|uniref:Uncharacterized protein n=1 Tax=Halorussus limi TaxID=2938695 RepID=A0A8U0HSC5_9EURY|nr:hypothetical protein [Halorussus limi]UPV73574.1 hypothetical protein M0R89_13620 [Halorussus limi]
MQDTCEPRRTANSGRPTEGDAMSDRCTYCDGPVSAEEWHPVATVRDDDGTVEIYDFCSENCLTAWQSERGNAE